MTSEQSGSPERVQRLARLAGAVYLVWGIAALAGVYHAPLVQPERDGLAKAITTSQARFQVAVLADVLATALAAPLALLLYELLKPVHKFQAALMAVLLLVAIPMSFVVALNYVAAHMLLSGVLPLPGIPAPERDALAQLFLSLHIHGVMAEEIYWGLWLWPFGLLVIRSRFLPKTLGVLLILAGVAWVAHGVTSLLLPGQRFAVYDRVTMVARGAGEFSIMLWLTFKGVDTRRLTS